MIKLKRMKSSFLLLSIFILIVMVFSGCDSQTVLKGEVEAPVFSQYAEVGGKIIEMPVELGQIVKQGDLIAVIDDTDAKYALEQANAALTKKKALLNQLEEGADSLEIKQARNNVELASANYDAKEILYQRALSDYENAKSLYEAGATTENAYSLAVDQKEIAEKNLEVAQTQIDNAQQSLNFILEGAGDQELVASEADVTQAESLVSQLENNLDKYRIYAMADGVVISKNYLLGDIVASGYNLIDISSQEEKYLVIYLPEEDVYSIEYGDKVTVKYGNDTCEGEVSFIDTKAQYTPKDMQTSANKNKDTIKVKLRLPIDSVLKPGEIAEVVI